MPFLTKYWATLMSDGNHWTVYAGRWAAIIAIAAYVAYMLYLELAVRAALLETLQ